MDSTKKLLIIAVVILAALSPTSEAIYYSSLPSITGYFNTSENVVQLSFTIYYIGFALGIFILGRISDLYGRRPVIIFGVLLYTSTCTLSSWSNSLELLMLLRFFQAFGASVGSVVSQAVSRDYFHGAELSKIYIMISITNAFVPSLGTTLGGYVIQYYDWYTVFKLLAVIGFVIYLYMKNCLVETNNHISTIRDHKYFAILKAVITDKFVLLNAFIIGAYNGTIFGFNAEAPFIFISKLNMEPSKYGKCIFLIAIAGIAGSMLCRWMLKQYTSSNDRIVYLGLCISLFGCFLLMLLSNFKIYNDNENLAIVCVFIPMMLQIFGQNIVVPIILRQALESYHKVTGTAGSVFGSLYYLLVALISFLVSVCHSYNSGLVMTLFFMISALNLLAFYCITKLKSLKSNLPS